MILLFTTRAHRYTAEGFRRLALPRPNLRQRDHGWLFQQLALSCGTAIFTDFDRLNYEQHRRAARIAGKMAEAGIRVLNRPAHVRGRYELLRRLFELGENPFQVWRAEERPRVPAECFPVFLKSEGTHGMPFGGLIESQEALDRAIEELPSRGEPLRHVLITQFCNEETRPGVWARLTIYRVGPRLFPGPPLIEDSPFVKYGKYGLAEREDFERLAAIWREGAHLDWARRMFEIARIDYGRADFGIEAGRPVLYEINTNPNIPWKHRSRDGAYLQISRATQRLVAGAVAALDTEDRPVDLSRINRREHRV